MRLVQTKFFYISWMIFAGLFAWWNSGCAPVQFSEATNCTSSNSCSAAALGGPQTYDYDVQDSALPVDILFVDDNSESMYVNQQTLGSKFSSLFNLISGYDYHVAITTTDVSGTGIAGRDGTLVPLSDGSTFISQQSVNPTNIFTLGIERPETETCDAYVKANNWCSGQNSCPEYNQMCPSSDSRGIFAANAVVQQNQGSWMRASAPLHVIIISNSDERNETVTNPPPNGPLTTMDLPATLVQTAAGRTLKVHTLIIQPNDSTCYKQQYTNQYVFGWYGIEYNQASSLTGGVNGTICTGSNYDSQLQQMGLDVQAQLQQNIPLNCATTDALMTYTITPQANPVITATVSANGMTLNLSAPLPIDSVLHLNYTCSSN